MSDKSKIEWTDATWTPIRARVKPDAGAIAASKGYASLVQIATRMQGHIGPHCEHVSPECDNCYSGENNSRCLPSNGTGLPFDRRSRDLVDVFVDESILIQPLHWKRPRKVFVCSQTDLFAEFVTDEMIDQVFAVMALCPQHTFQVLTKRSERMYRYCSSGTVKRGRTLAIGGPERIPVFVPFPLPNVWLGVSVGDQQRADERIPHLLNTPAAVRFLSVEPLLGRVDLKWEWLTPQCPKCGTYVKRGSKDCTECDGKPSGAIDWVIVGGESGRGARPMHPDWVKSIRDQCIAAQVPFFFKQWGEWRPLGTADMDSNDWDVAMAMEPCESKSVRISLDGRVDDGNSDPEPSQVGAWMMERIGKKAAGRIIDGRTWDEMPEVSQ